MRINNISYKQIMFLYQISMFEEKKIIELKKVHKLKQTFF